MEYIRRRCSGIPVPRVFYHDEQYLIMEKVSSTRGWSLALLKAFQAPGVRLQDVYEHLSLYDKHRIVTQVATWMVQLFNNRFEESGSLYSDGEGDFFIGPITADPFCAGARASMDMDRGPWSTSTEYETPARTSSATKLTLLRYFFACAQRELDLARSLDGPGTSAEYQGMLDREKQAVERSMDLLVEIVIRCNCLDEDDPELAPFAIDLDDFGPRNIFVDPEQPSEIVSNPGNVGIVQD